MPERRFKARSSVGRAARASYGQRYESVLGRLREIIEHLKRLDVTCAVCGGVDYDHDMDCPLGDVFDVLARAEDENASEHAENVRLLKDSAWREGGGL